MKNKYEKMLDDIELKDDPKDQVRQAVFQYEVKKKSKNRNLKLAISVCAVLTLVVSTVIMNLNLHKESSFIIKASENLYKIDKANIELKEFEIKKDFSFFEQNKNKYTLYNALPLAIFVEGEDIESITFHLNTGDFWRYAEKSATDERGQGSSGFGITKYEKIMNYLKECGFEIVDDPSKEEWEFFESGDEITIAYEDQRTMNGLYGVNLSIVDEGAAQTLDKLFKMHLAEMIESEYGSSYLDETTMEYLNKAKQISREDRSKMLEDTFKSIENKIYDTLNQLELDIRVNYKDGTYETTKLNFSLDKENFKLNLADVNNSFINEY